MDNHEGWENKKRILIILAHPDDPEFFLGGTIARWTNLGHDVRYCLLTKGDKGTNDPEITPQMLKGIREKEQKKAASKLGVSEITFLNYEDGYIIPDLAMRKEIVKVIRQHKPDILVTCDPQNYFSNRRYINHPDHRAAGQVVIDAVFPAAGNINFFPELLDEGIRPHTVEEVWLSLTSNPNVILDIKAYWLQRLSALIEHRSQIGDVLAFEKRMVDNLPKDEHGNLVYEEKFHRIIFRR